MYLHLKAGTVKSVALSVGDKVSQGTLVITLGSTGGRRCCTRAKRLLLLLRQLRCSKPLLLHQVRTKATSGASSPICGVKKAAGGKGTCITCGTQTGP